MFSLSMSISGVLEHSHLAMRGRLYCGVDELLEEECCLLEGWQSFALTTGMGELFCFLQHGRSSFLTGGMV